MLDVETLGTNANSPILSIGAVSSTGETFYRNLDVQKQLDGGATVDWSTVLWWMEQSEDARKSIPAQGDNVNEALRAFVEAFDWDNSEVWCNGASFDFPILEAAFRREGIRHPWTYNRLRDFRTLYKLYADVVPRANPKVAHNALSDAEAQMATLMEILNEHKTRNLIQMQYRKEAAQGFIPDEKQQSICGGHCG